MADTVTSRVLVDNRRRYVVELTCVSDGTGESAVTKVNLSTIGGASHNPEDGGTTTPTYTRVEKISYAQSGFDYIKLYWDHTTPATIAIMPDGTHQDFDFHKFGGLIDPKTAGGTGNILLTSSGPVAGATYNIVISLIKKY